MDIYERERLATGRLRAERGGVRKLIKKTLGTKDKNLQEKFQYISPKAVVYHIDHGSSSTAWISQH